MGWEWKEECVKNFAAKMQEFKYSPWWVGTRCAELYDFLYHCHDEDERTETKPS